ncbi:alpha/beta hydrolase [Nocardiopsis exhalans]|uniref:Alpha/beta hydrolase n=1 Tax=Nocardiopsis exhalans TaxID=163604 RepID=A0ABY5D3G2_9ACTN|nr:alpha/beta hydrolase [Nocardiopsis exhalans]USY17694.1 alpha/beta hydrolase [Nocardiopsis exhalans]
MGAAVAVAALAAWSALTTGTETGAAALPTPEERARATAERMAEHDIVDLPVTFTVTNDNDSRLPCNSDGGAYTLHGHLTAPRAVLTADGPAVTLYQHGQAAGEWFWRLDEQGAHHTEGMALLGQASLTLDRLGYGASERPDGMAMCLGGQAAMTSQVIAALRTGDYGVADTPDDPDLAQAPPAFDRVVLAGHHNGAQIAQITAYSYDGAAAPDALVLMGWSGIGLTDRANARFFGGLASCMQGGVPAATGTGPPENVPGQDAGYAYVDVGSANFRESAFHTPESEVALLAASLQNRTPCGDLGTQVEAVVTDTRNLHGIDLPVFFAFGEADSRVADVAQHAEGFTGAPETHMVSLPDSGHYFVMEPAGERLRAELADWLEAR